MNINANTLRAYENGRSIPNQEVLEQICVKFSVNPAWLLLGTGPMKEVDKDSSSEKAVYEAKIKDLERKLAAAKDEALKAYKLAVEAMRTSTSAIQEPENPTTPEGESPVFHKMLENHGLKRK